MSSFKPDLNAHLRDWQNIKLPLVAPHVTFESLTSPKGDDDDPDVLEIERAGLCVFLELVCVYFLPFGRGVFLSTLWRLSSFSYSYPPSLTPWVVPIIKISHCNFLEVELMVVWNHRILTKFLSKKLLWLYESGSDVCLCEIIGLWRLDISKIPTPPHSLARHKVKYGAE